MWFYLVCLVFSVLSAVRGYNTVYHMYRKHWRNDSSDYLDCRRQVLVGLVFLAVSGATFYFASREYQWNWWIWIPMGVTVVLNAPTLFGAAVLFSRSQCCWFGRTLKWLKKQLTE
jgi:hypothetical protein